MDSSDLAVVSAWECDRCHRLISAQHAPTTMIVLVPGPVIEMLAEPIETPYVKRKIVICEDCRDRIVQR